MAFSCLVFMRFLGSVSLKLRGGPPAFMLFCREGRQINVCFNVGHNFDGPKVAKFLVKLFLTCTRPLTIEYLSHRKYYLKWSFS